MKTKLGIFLKKKRELKGLSRKAFVEQMPEETRISDSTLAQIENGKIKNPPEKRLLGFSKVLGIAVNVLKQLLVATALVITTSFLFPKEAAAIKLIKEYEPEEGYHLAFSGGKDSCVIKFLAQKAGVKFKAHMGITTIDFPDLIGFVKTYHPDVVLHKPKLSMFKLISEVKHSLPTRVGRYCCEHLKEYLGKGEFVMQGIRWDESNARSKRDFFEYDTRSSMNDKMYLNPIIDWSTKEIWKYIHHYNIPYCKLYDQGFDRLGCIGCPMSGPSTMKRELNSNPKYKNMYIKAIRKAQSALNKHGQPYAIKSNFSDEYDAYNWWVSGLSISEYNANKNQLKLDL